MHPIQKCLARIYYGDDMRHNIPCGAGVVVDDHKLLTCAHVIKASLGLREVINPQDQLVNVDFPLAAINKKVTARVVFWDIETDIAGLEFVEEIPDEIIPVFLHKTDDLMDNSIKAFGFPSGYPKGTWAKGELRGPIESGWIEVVDSQLTGHFVQQGFSGGPVWDETLQCCIGIVVAADTIASTRTSYLIPSAIIGSKWTLLSVKTAQPKRHAAVLKDIPELVLHFINRRKQEEGLAELYKRNSLQTPQPMVVVIHGDDMQAQDMFRQRIARQFIPKLLKINTRQTPVMEFSLPWPTHAETIQELGGEFTRRLGEDVLGEFESCCEDIQRAFVEYNSPVIIETEVLTSDWMNLGESVLEAFLDFWNNWPALAPKQNLFIFLYVTHKTLNINETKRHEYMECNERMVTKLKQYPFDDYKKIHGKVLARLTNISETEARDWARAVANEYFNGEISLLIKNIRKLFENEETIAMDPLASQLKEILKSASGD